MSCTVSDEKTARTSYMNHCPKATHRLANMQDQKSLTLHWLSFSGCGRERVAILLALQGGQYLIYGCLQLITCWITQDARPKIDDALSMVIVRMGQGAGRFCFCFWRRPIPHLLMFASNCNLEYQDGTPEDFEAPLRLSSRMGHGACRDSLCLSRQPIPHLWMDATNHHIVYPRCRAKNHWQSVDAHFQHGAVTVSLAIFLIKLANTLGMHSSHLITS